MEYDISSDNNRVISWVTCHAEVRTIYVLITIIIPFTLSRVLHHFAMQHTPNVMGWQSYILELHLTFPEMLPTLTIEPFSILDSSMPLATACIIKNVP